MHFFKTTTLAAIAASFILKLVTATETMPVYVSGYTDKGGEGIYKYTWNNGKLSGGELAAKAEAPSYFTIKQDSNTLYAVSELEDYEGTGGGTVIAFKRNKEDGSLTQLDEEATFGKAPCYAVADNDNVYAANYNSGSVSVIPISKDDNGVEPLDYLLNHTAPASGGVPDRQEAAHAHSFDFIDDTWSVSCDLGTDQAVVYKKSNGKVEESSAFQFPNGTGPRHAAISHDGKKVYVLSELDSQVFVLDFDSETGTLTELERHYAGPDGAVDGGAEIELSPNGEFLYASVRFINMIAVYKVDKDTGKLKVVDYQPSGGDHPRHFKIDPSGQFLLVGNMNSDNIVIFKINQETGLLEDGETIDHPQPTCIKFWT